MNEQGGNPAGILAARGGGAASMDWAPRGRGSGLFSTIPRRRELICKRKRKRQSPIWPVAQATDTSHLNRRSRVRIPSAAQAAVAQWIEQRSEKARSRLFPGLIFAGIFLLRRKRNRHKPPGRWRRQRILPRHGGDAGSIPASGANSSRLVARTPCSVAALFPGQKFFPSAFVRAG
jgi:hypothetical protein